MPIIATIEKFTDSKDFFDIEVHKIKEIISVNITTSNCNDFFFM